MYTLRRVSGNGVVMNQDIGDSYTYISRETSYDDFCKAFKKVYGKPHVADLDDNSDDDTKNVFGFVSGKGGALLEPLRGNQRNSIITENGKTLEQLRY